MYNIDQMNVVFEREMKVCMTARVKMLCGADKTLSEHDAVKTVRRQILDMLHDIAIKLDNYDEIRHVFFPTCQKRGL